MSAAMRELLAAFGCAGPATAAQTKALGEHYSLWNLEDGKAAVHALAVRQRIDSREELGNAIQSTLVLLLDASKADPTGLLRPERLPDALQLLVALARPPTQATVEYARELVRERLHPPSPTRDLKTQWDELFDDGDASDRSTASQRARYYAYDSDAEGSQLSSSSSTSSVPFPPTPEVVRVRPTRKGKERAVQLDPAHAGLHRLGARQYWRDGWRSDLPQDDRTVQPVSADPSRFAGSLLPHDPTVRAVDEVDVVREVLVALQGQPSIFFSRDRQASFAVATDAPTLLHTSPQSFHSLLAEFLVPLNQLAQIDTFLTTVARSPLGSHSRTIEAFSEAMAEQVRTFRRWCTDRETEILAPRDVLTVSLLRLSQELSCWADELESLVLALDCIGPSAPGTPSTLLNFLAEAIDHAYLISDPSSAARVRALFIKTAEPLWSLTGQWLTRGIMDTSRSNEFFVRRNAKVLESDAEYFASGFELVQGELPEFLEEMAQGILEAGKCRHLLKRMGEEPGAVEWPSFLEVVEGPQLAVGAHVAMRFGKTETVQQALFSPPAHPSTVVLPTLAVLPSHQGFTSTLLGSLETLCLPLVAETHRELHRVIMDDCNFTYHLRAIQGIFLMREGGDVGAFVTGLFEKMERGQAWYDYSLLQEAWNQAVTPGTWMDPTLLRLRVASSRSLRANARSMRALEHLALSYAIPSPLGYLIPPSALDKYAAIFVFLLQLRRGTYLLDRLSLLKSSPLQDPQELKSYYALRMRLSWIVSTLKDFFLGVVLDREVRSFERVVQESKGTEALAVEHEKFISRIHDRLLLGRHKAQPVHRAIMSILEYCVALSDNWTTLNGDTTMPDMSRRPSFSGRMMGGRKPTATSNTRYRRRRTVEQSFEDTSDEEDSDDEDQSMMGGLATTSFVSFAEEGFSLRVERMDRDLAGLLGFIKRSVEGLATSAPSPDVREVYGILAWRLQAWK